MCWPLLWQIILCGFMSPWPHSPANLSSGDLLKPPIHILWEPEPDTVHCHALPLEGTVKRLRDQPPIPLQFQCAGPIEYSKTFKSFIHFYIPHLWFYRSERCDFFSMTKKTEPTQTGWGLRRYSKKMVSCSPAPVRSEQTNIPKTLALRFSESLKTQRSKSMLLHIHYVNF